VAVVATYLATATLLRITINHLPGVHTAITLLRITRHIIMAIPLTIHTMANLELRLSIMHIHRKEVHMSLITIIINSLLLLPQLQEGLHLGITMTQAIQVCKALTPLACMEVVVTRIPIMVIQWFHLKHPTCHQMEDQEKQETMKATLTVVVVVVEQEELLPLQTTTKVILVEVVVMLTILLRTMAPLPLLLLVLV